MPRGVAPPDCLARGGTLTYAPGNPGKCPTNLDAGQVADRGIVYTDFEVTGSSELVVATF